MVPLEQRLNASLNSVTLSWGQLFHSVVGNSIQNCISVSASFHLHLLQAGGWKLSERPPFLATGWRNVPLSSKILLSALDQRLNKKTHWASSCLCGSLFSWKEQCTQSKEMDLSSMPNHGAASGLATSTHSPWLSAPTHSPLTTSFHPHHVGLCRSH